VAAAPDVALFDLDGTLTRHDTLAGYLAGFLREHPARYVRMLRVLPVLTRFALHRADRGELKAVAIGAAMGGFLRAEVQAWTTRFVPPLIAHGMFADALATLERHRQAGDTLVLLSASPDLYVPEIARQLGFFAAMCTGMRWEGERLTGELATANRRGAEKVRCLTELRASYPQRRIIAYGNAGSDLAHLALADHGVLVNGSRAARRDAARLNIERVTWR
jgi:phosphatidylglycerophosphatase C